jgi:Spy/CpxP family protein refolding chaperone
MRKMIPAYLILLACALPAMNSYAATDGDHCDGKEGPHHAMHFNPMHRMTERLGLSEDQQQKFKALQEKNKAAYQTQHEALRENNKQMHELITSGAYTDEKAAQLADKEGEIVTALAKLRATEMAGLYALLTPEQRNKFSSFHSEDNPVKG